MTSAEWVNLLTPVVGPVLTAVATKVVPKIPKPFVPVLAVGLGAAANLLGAKAIAGVEPNLLQAAALGLAGIGVYEVTKPVTKKAACAAASILMGALLLLSPPVYAAEAAPEYYKAGEFQIGSFYQTRTEDFEKERGSTGVEVSYFLTKNIGLSAATDLSDLNGQLIENVGLRAIYRVPVEKSALYGYAGAVRLIEEEEWALQLGIGAQHQFSKWVQPFVEAGMLKQIDHGAEAIGRVGLRISF